MQQAQQPMPQQPAQGLNALPSNLPTENMYDGGIVSFAGGGDIDDDEDDERNEEAEYMQALQQAQETSDLSAEAASEGIASAVPSKGFVNRTPNVEQGIKAGHGEPGLSQEAKGITGLRGKEFYNTMYDNLLAQAKEMGVKNPEAIARLGAAQSALETGYGKNTAGGNNYFGIKGAGSKQKTQEYNPKTGQLEDTMDSFRKYGSMGDSASDYINFLQTNPRYADVLKAESPEQAIALQGKTGYATDPEYAQKLASIHRSNAGITALASGGKIKHFDSGDSVFDKFKNLLSDVGQATQNIQSAPINENKNILNIAKQNAIEAGNEPNPFDVPVSPNAEKYSTAASDIQDMASPQDQTVPVATTPAYSDAQRNAGFDAAKEYNLRANAPRVGTSYAPAQPATDQSNAKAQADALSALKPSPNSYAPVNPQKNAFDEFMEQMRQERGETKQQKEEDKYMALLTAGLGMMGGTSPYAMANIGQGALAGVANYAQSSRQRTAELAALNKGLISAQRYKELGDIAKQNQLANEAYRGQTLKLHGRQLDVEAERNNQLDLSRQATLGETRFAHLNNELQQLQNSRAKAMAKWDDPTNQKMYPEEYKKAKALDIPSPREVQINQILSNETTKMYPELQSSSGTNIKYDSSGKIIQ
jgi:flagellum-specific peptidoglycan hydrolase FlgJ